MDLRHIVGRWVEGVNAKSAKRERQLDQDYANEVVVFLIIIAADMVSSEAHGF